MSLDSGYKDGVAGAYPDEFSKSQLLISLKIQERPSDQTGRSRADKLQNIQPVNSVPEKLNCCQS